MNFDLTEEEEMMKAVATRFVTERYDLNRRRAYLLESNGFSAENWAQLGALGLIAAPFEIANGGLGVGLAGLAAIFEALGRGLTVEPLVECAVLAGSLFEQLASERLKRDWQGRLVSGERRVVLAHREYAARHNSAWVETKARYNGKSAYLSGAKSLVAAGNAADAFLVSARYCGETDDPEGVALFLIDAQAEGITIRPWRLMDGSVAASLTLENVQVDNEKCLGGGLRHIEAAQSRASLVRSAEALGIMDRLFEETLDYLRTRQQFGAPLCSFQALQHRMVDQYANLEQARALLNLALMEGTSGAIDGARAFIADISVTFGHEMIQMHGGMGLTNELSIGHAHKRLLVLSRWPDEADDALDRFGAPDRSGTKNVPIEDSRPAVAQNGSALT